MDTNQPIGVIDSGVGGLSVLRALQQTMPHETFLYLGDTARAPYGTRSRETITAFVAQMTDWLEQKESNSWWRPAIRLRCWAPT